MKLPALFALVLVLLVVVGGAVVLLVQLENANVQIKYLEERFTALETRVSEIEKHDYVITAPILQKRLEDLLNERKQSK
jgi:Tfp pilus assembly protein PilN